MGPCRHIVKTIEASFKKGRLPLSTACSATFGTPKAGNKEGIKSLRVLHVFDAFGMAIHGATVKQYDILPADFAHGCVNTRSTTGAIAVIANMLWRCKNVGLPTIVSNYGAANAFGCSCRPALHKAQQEYTPQCEQVIAKTTVDNHIACIEAFDKTIILKPSSGAPAGHATSARDFVQTYTPQVSAWTTEIAHSLCSPYRWLRASLPDAAAPVDLSTVGA